MRKVLSDHFKALAVQATDDCLQALMEDADLNVGMFLESWAMKHEVPEDQLSDFVNHTRQHLATEVALSALADKGIRPPGIDPEEYTARRRYGLEALHLGVSAMFERRRRKAWDEPKPSSLKEKGEGKPESEEER